MDGSRLRTSAARLYLLSLSLSQASLEREKPCPLPVTDVRHLCRTDVSGKLCRTGSDGACRHWVGLVGWLPTRSAQRAPCSRSHSGLAGLALLGRHQLSTASSKRAHNRLCGCMCCSSNSNLNCGDPTLPQPVLVAHVRPPKLASAHPLRLTRGAERVTNLRIGFCFVLLLTCSSGCFWCVSLGPGHFVCTVPVTPKRNNKARMRTCTLAHRERGRGKRREGREREREIPNSSPTVVSHVAFSFGSSVDKLGSSSLAVACGSARRGGQRISEVSAPAMCPLPCLQGAAHVGWAVAQEAQA